MLFMKKFVSLFFGFIFLTLFSTASVSAFDLTVLTARKVLELAPGDEARYELQFKDDFNSGIYQVKILEFTYDQEGRKQFIQQEEIADESQSLTGWLKFDSQPFQVEKGVIEVLPIQVVVPEQALFGDRYAELAFEKVVADGGEDHLITVGGSVSSLLVVKVLGGDSVKSGRLNDYQILTEERARNTARFVFEFVNTGNEFFGALAEIEIFDGTTDTKPIKVLTREFTALPNVLREVRVSLGDLGDEYEEKEYRTRLTVYEYHQGVKKSQMGVSEKSFYYFIPVSDLHFVAKEMESPSFFSLFVRELGIYALGFFLLLAALVWGLLGRRG